MNLVTGSFSSCIFDVEKLMRDGGEVVQTEKWQGTRLEKQPGSEMVELINVSMCCPMPSSNPKFYHSTIKPNLPWADDHFEERVCGYPINPGVEWKNWPWSNKARESLDSGGMFNHNYMERYWPSDGVRQEPTETVEEFLAEDKKWSLSDTAQMGLRHQYGDLEDLCELLAYESTTRQAYMPIWFPEDTGTTHFGRKPCTLGYHFIVRKQRLHLVYYIRSCDMYRHFKDDIYLTLRLGIYIIGRCRKLNPKTWNHIYPGDFTMHITSLHMFVNDYIHKFKRSPHANN